MAESFPVWLPCLKRLYYRWWRDISTDLTIANTFIALPELDMSYTLNQSHQHLLIRLEYVYLFNRLRSFSATPHGVGCGIVVTGQPGIGKSIFLLYALLRALQNGEELVLHFDGETYIMTQNGPIPIDPSYLQEMVKKPVWALIDSDRRKKVPPSPWLTKHRLVLPIFATSPDKDRYDWLTRRNGVTFVMDPWTYQELLLSVRLLGNTQILQNLYESRLPQAVYVCGPVIRDINTFVLSELPTPITVRMDAALDFSSFRDLAKLFLTYSSSCVQESHSVILMRRRLTTDPLSGDEILLDFRSGYVAEHAWSRLWELEHDESLKYFALFGQHATLSIASGWAFENIAHRYMCQITPTRPNLPPMHSLVYSAGPTFTRIIGSTPSYFLPIHNQVRTPIFYSMASEVKLDASAYYIPRRTNNPLFDALFFGPNIIPAMDASSVSSPFALYVLQMSTATVHGGSDKGVDIICDILRANLCVGGSRLCSPHLENAKWLVL
ncbi:uncharacterized protein ARMOST_12107 [Armillaria ostoyae]|uniref:Uncharacterized protein n=1 Tax=Armillaria ostoyae TaxID=47428 RepID=A0A284RJ50_ARMOS|nr:uncharacterized protein ARMOST_12107 [Armillaria ostoyae]